MSTVGPNQVDISNPDRNQLLRFVDLPGERFYTPDPLPTLESRDMFNVIDTVRHWKIDLIFRKDRPFSRSEFERREPVMIAGVSTFVATAEDTVLAKLEWAKRGQSDRALSGGAMRNEGMGVVRTRWL